MRASTSDKGQGLRFKRDGSAAWIWLRSIGIAAAVSVAYFLAAELSNSFLITPETVIFWPAAGISSGLLISLWSIARWPVLAGVMIATAAANLLRPFDVAVTATWVLGNAAEPLIVAGLVQHYFGAHFRIDRLYSVLGLFAVALAGTTIASTWWTFAYYYLFASLNEPAATWLHWIVSDFAGIVSVAPLVIGAATLLRRPPARREAIESMAALGVLGVMSGVIVSLPLGLWETVVPVALIFPILLWLSARWQPVFSAAGVFIVSMSVALTAIYGLGHFGDSGLSISARVLQTQAVILVVAFGTAVLAALFAERRDSEAQLVGANTMLKDERERLAHSNAMLQRERNDRLMSFDAITAAISHEIAQPIGAIVMSTETAGILLEKTPFNHEKIRETLNRINSDGRRTTEILDGIRSLFRRADKERHLVDLNEIIRAVLQLSQDELKLHNVTSVLALAPSLPVVEGNRNQLQQVIFNFVHNAVEAMDAVPDQRRTLRLTTERRSDNTIAVAVRDTGPGIDPKLLDGIFDAFVTTKAHGMGLGLAICRMIIDRHGGQLTASSDGKNGSLFQFVLPMAGGKSTG